MSTTEPEQLETILTPLAEALTRIAIAMERIADVLTEQRCAREDAIVARHQALRDEAERCERVYDGFELSLIANRPVSTLAYERADVARLDAANALAAFEATHHALLVARGLEVSS